MLEIMETEQTNCTVILDVSGTLFKTQLSTLRSIPGSRLAQLDNSSNSYDETQDTFYFNRDADMFKQILNAHRYGAMHIPRDICPLLFKGEMAFWKIPIKLLAPCCWKTLYETHNDVDVTVDLWNRDYKTQAQSHMYNLNKDEQDLSGHKVGNIQDRSAHTTNNTQDLSASKTSEEFETLGKGLSSHKFVKPGMKPNKVWLFLEEPTSSTPAKIWCFVYVALVLLNVFTLLTFAIPMFRVDSYLLGSNKPLSKDPRVGMQIENHTETIKLLIKTDQHPVLFTIDCFCLFVFIIEVVVHFWSCPHKKNYYKDPKNIIRPVLCIAMMINILFYLFKMQIHLFSPSLIKVCSAIHSISVLRLLFILNLRKLYRGLDIMLMALEKSRRELLLLLFTFGILVVVYGTMMFSAEIETDKFSNVWYSLWWSTITMTTVGYGDFYPQSTLGYFIGALCAINGLIVLALPLACIASNFSTLNERQADIDKHKDQITLERNQNGT